MRAARKNCTARVLSLGCGPAQEVQRFVAGGDLAQNVDFTLIDFDQETAEYTRATLHGLVHKHGRSTSVQVIRKSVSQILKESGRTIERERQNQYDFVYCAGLFDYLSESICRRLSSVLYEWVTPGGLFLSTNVDNSNPRRLTMDYIMDWHLIYRDGAQLAAMRPEPINGAEEAVVADFTGVNIHYTAKKPERG
jgi:extracellular factor (EF) 3-hydroxypalmitic acid methyl ester biosynthesis protein